MKERPIREAILEELIDNPALAEELIAEEIEQIENWYEIYIYRKDDGTLGALQEMVELDKETGIKVSIDLDQQDVTHLKDQEQWAQLALDNPPTHDELDNIEVKGTLIGVVPLKK
jgi:hypothetical protein